MTADDVHGGSGWVIRASDLRPSITDVDAFRAGMVHDPLAAAIELLWTGHPANALVLFQQQGPSLRVRALTADCHRDLGNSSAALEAYDTLVAETVGSATEATMRQHCGKARLAAGCIEGAAEDFRRAVALRRGSTAELSASAQQALRTAQRMLAHRARDNPPS